MSIVSTDIRRLDVRNNYKQWDNKKLIKYSSASVNNQLMFVDITTRRSWEKAGFIVQNSSDCCSQMVWLNHNNTILTVPTIEGKWRNYIIDYSWGASEPLNSTLEMEFVALCPDMVMHAKYELFHAWLSILRILNCAEYYLLLSQHKSLRNCSVFVGVCEYECA